jgi:hypothetical protein
MNAAAPWLTVINFDQIATTSSEDLLAAMKWQTKAIEIHIRKELKRRGVETAPMRSQKRFRAMVGR